MTQDSSTFWKKSRVELRAAGFDLRMHLAPVESHDDVLGDLEAARTPRERKRRDRQVAAWRQAVPAQSETQ